MFTACVIRYWGLGDLFGPFLPKHFGHTTNTRHKGRENHLASGVGSRNNLQMHGSKKREKTETAEKFQVAL